MQENGNVGKERVMEKEDRKGDEQEMIVKETVEKKREGMNHQGGRKGKMMEMKERRGKEQKSKRKGMKKRGKGRTLKFRNVKGTIATGLEQAVRRDQDGEENISRWEEMNTRR